MLIISILYLCFVFNLVNILAEKTTTFYKDIRFWMVFISLMLLMFLTLKGYPVS